MKGILKVISKNGGIKIGDDDRWINPSPQAKIDILDRLEEAKELLLNNEVSVDLDLQTKNWTGINLIRKIEPELITPKVDKDKIIVRQNCLSHATKYAELIMDDRMDSKVVEEIIFNFAKKCEEWIWR